MTEKVDPPKTDNNQPLRGETGGENKDSPSPRLPKNIFSPILEWPRYISETIRYLAYLIDNNYWIFLLALVIVFVTFTGVYLSTRPGSPLDNIAFVGGVVILIALLAFIDKNITEKRKTKSGKWRNGAGEFLSDSWQSELSKEQNEFVEFYRQFKNHDALIDVKRITRQMLDGGEFYSIRKNAVNLQNYKSSGLYQEGSNKDFIEVVPPLNTPRIYAMELIYIYGQEGRDKKNKEGVDLNLANTPVPGTKDKWWWTYPWSDVLINLSLIASEKSTSRIINQLLSAFEKDKKENFEALQVCCKIVSSGAKVEGRVLTGLLNTISNENLQIKKAKLLDKS
ncbi:MAG: hypothetical protein CNIPEHKO_01284 [Anaerolineales bacterium]|nr:hypothetical protein [Anaerolineales bacterium]